MKFNSKYSRLVDEVSKQFEDFDLTTSEESQKGSKSRYVAAHRHEYIRTLSDVIEHFGDRKDVRVFEIGAFFGVVSIALSRYGYDVTASDVPEYMSLPAQQERFSREGVKIDTMRLQDFIIDKEDESVDCVIMCEVLEHLNFNPLPLMKEINRILVPGGLFYVALPNQNSIRNRLRFLAGKSVGIPISDFYEQLDPAKPVIANGHWREYSMQDLQDLLVPLGFETKRHYYFGLSETLPGLSFKRSFGKAFYRFFPQMKENQTGLFLRKERTPLKFSIPGTVHPTISEM